MARIVSTAEANRMPARVTGHPRTKAHTLARAATELTTLASVRAVVLFTRSGLTAQLVAKERPTVAIIAFTASETVFRQLALWWGVTPILGRFQPSTDAQVAALSATILDRGYAAPGDTVLLMGALPLTERARTNFLMLHRLKERHSHPGASSSSQ
jgi:pyruvate kinase